MKSKKKLVEEYIQKIISKLCCEYGTSLEDARKAVEELDLLNRYKGNYDFVLYQNVSTWVNLIVNKRKVDKRKKEVERENLENKTTVRPQSNHILVYTEQPTTKNTKYGDVVLYDNEVWLNDGSNVFTAIPLRDLDGYIDKDGTILKLPIKNYVDEKVEEALKENTMENYIVINGKKAELTEEQLKQLGIEVKKARNNPFDSTPRQVHVYSIGHVGVQTFGSALNPADLSMTESLVNTTNSFNDYDFARQLYLRELFNRKLLKYAYDNEAEDCEWGNNDLLHYYIVHDKGYHDRFFVTYSSHLKNINTTYFSKKGIAEQAIEDIVKPFMKFNPDFVW